jgi:hypothetical protein
MTAHRWSSILHAERGEQRGEVLGVWYSPFTE